MFWLRRACAATSWESAGRVSPVPEAVVDIAMEELMMISTGVQYEGRLMDGGDQESRKSTE